MGHVYSTAEAAMVACQREVDDMAADMLDEPPIPLRWQWDGVSSWRAFCEPLDVWYAVHQREVRS